MGHDLTAATITVAGAHGDPIPAYIAQPTDVDSCGGVVVIHHAPGWDRGTKEMTRRFADLGYNAICPNLNHRDAPDASPAEAAAASRAAGGVPDDRMLGDVSGAIDHLRALPSSNGRVAVIGHCAGGRQAILAASQLDLDAAIECYGAFVTVSTPEGYPIHVPDVVDSIPALGCPLLGLHGNDDKNPAPREVDDLEALLQQHGKEYELHRYDDAAHAFMAVERAEYSVAATVDAWERIADFLARHL